MAGAAEHVTSSESLLSIFPTSKSSIFANYPGMAETIPSLAYLPTIMEWLRQSQNVTLCSGSALIPGLSRNLYFSALFLKY